MAPTKSREKNGRTKKKKNNSSQLKNIHKAKEKFVNKPNEKKKHKLKLQIKNKENLSSNDRYHTLNINKFKRRKKQGKTPSVGTPKVQISDEEKAEINSRTVFVGNLPKSVTRKKLKRLFSKYGEVESARLRCSALTVQHMPRAIAIDKQYFHPKATSIIGFVKFTDKKTVKKALKANGTLYEDHNLRVDRIDSDRTDNVQNSVFIGNLPFEIADNDVRKHFENCGAIESVHVIRDAATGLGKGFGYVNFKSLSSVELALKLNGTQLIKRNIRVKRAVKKFAQKRQNEKILNDEKKNNQQIMNDSLKSDENIYSFRPKRPKKEKKKKKDKSELAFQGCTANKIQKKKSKKKLKKELSKKRLVEVLNKM